MMKKKMHTPRGFQKVQSRACVKQALCALGFEYELLPHKDKADFRVHPQGGGPAFNVLAYGRCIVWAKKRNDNLHIAFCDPPDSDHCEVYMYPHDEFLDLFIQGKVGRNAPPNRWKNDHRSWPTLTSTVREALEPYRLPLHPPKE